MDQTKEARVARCEPSKWGYKRERKFDFVPHFLNQTQLDRERERERENKREKARVLQASPCNLGKSVCQITLGQERKVFYATRIQVRTKDHGFCRSLKIEIFGINSLKFDLGDLGLLQSGIMLQEQYY